MSTNPNNSVGTNGAFGGRTSVNAFNDVMGAFQSRGVLSGWGISPSSGMTVSVGGNGTTRDVAVAEDANGNKTSVNNISGAPILVTLDSAPASNSRYDAIVAYVDKPPMGNATQDNPECCGIIPVSGTAASSPAYPSDSTIRSAITADGASGATAYYAVVGYVRVASGTTAITSAMITAGAHPTTNAMVQTWNIAAGAVTSDKIDWATYLTSGTGTLNSTYFTSGSCKWYKMGKMVVAYVTSARLSQAPPSSGGVVPAISGLPRSSSSFPENFFILHTNGGSNNPLRLSIKPSSTDVYFHWTTNTVQNTDIDGQIIYFTD